MDRESVNVPSCQIGFIDYLVLPLFEAWDKFVAVPEVLENLRKNRELWGAVKATPNKPTGNSAGNSNSASTHAVTGSTATSANPNPTSTTTTNHVPSVPPNNVVNSVIVQIRTASNISAFGLAASSSSSPAVRASGSIYVVEPSHNNSNTHGSNEGASGLAHGGGSSGSTNALSGPTKIVDALLRIPSPLRSTSTTPAMSSILAESEDYSDEESDGGEEEESDQENKNELGRGHDGDNGDNGERIGESENVVVTVVPSVASHAGLIQPSMRNSSSY
ncbi:hypothetical protein HK102_009319 [Quaeritorhiza haematococci]|nr:hypothetical protein HK102_009319 [Quaeritorhiza haematococci]